MQAHAQADQFVILLAEDEPIVRNMIRAILTAEGYFVLDVADGVQAVELSRKYPGTIHLLLTDLRMPNLGGAKAAQTITAERPGIRLLVISGHGSDDIREEMASRAFLRKPFLPEALRKKIREVLDSPSEPQAGMTRGEPNPPV
jgi:CheY-like chemotaxis protein